MKKLYKKAKANLTQTYDKILIQPTLLIYFMHSLQESDQVTYFFTFKITPIDIVSTKSIKNLKKSLLLKLGNRTQKTSELNKPIEIPVEVLYSKTLKKYCPIKGIIKVYDINLDGSEVISSVGGFQTQEILNQNKTDAIIQKDVGTSKIKMKIQIKNMGVIKGQPQSPQKQRIIKKQQSKNMLSRSGTSQNTGDVQPNNLGKSRQSLTGSHRVQVNQDESKNQKSHQYFKRTSLLSNVSSSQRQPKISEVKMKAFNKPKSGSIIQNPTSDVNQFQSEFRKESSFQQSSFTQSYLRERQNEELGQLLKEERRKIVGLEKKLAKNHKKLVFLNTKIVQNQKEISQLIQDFQKIIQGLETKNGKFWVQNNDKQKLLGLKYKDKTFEKLFGTFLEIMIFQIQKRKTNKGFQEQGSDEQISKPNTKLSINQTRLQSQVKRLNEELSKKTNEIFTLRIKQRQKGSIQIKMKSKQRQYSERQSQIRELQILTKTLKEQNAYLKQKDETIQQILTQKQNEIENLKQEITEIDLEIKEMESTIKNDGCQIEELKEQVSNLNQIIDSYRQKYGELKNTKSRALQNELKECLIWIDQQTRELQMSDFDEETQPSHSHNVSQIIKNIELQGASREEMNSIKVQLAGLIKRIDNFLAK